MHTECSYMSRILHQFTRRIAADGDGDGDGDDDDDDYMIIPILLRCTMKLPAAKLRRQEN